MKAYDLQTGIDLISSLSLVDSNAASVRIHALLDKLQRSPPAVEVYLSLLERLPTVVATALGDLRKQLVGKALPLAENEETTFQQTVLTWLKLAHAYAQCAQIDAAQKSAPNLQRRALLLQRCIYFTGLAIGEHHRAKRELAPGLWLDLHGYYVKAEAWGVAQRSIAGCLEQNGADTNCTAAFLLPLLADLSDPCALSLQDLEWVTRLAGIWSPLVQLRTADAEAALPPLLVDLGQDAGLCPSTEGHRRADFRLVDPSRLGSRLQQVRQQLNQGEPPHRLGLGSTARSGQCKRLLEALARPWSLSPTLRLADRHQSIGSAQMDADFAEMHFHISGKEFQQRGRPKVYSRHEIEVMLTFRHRVEPASEPEVRPKTPGFVFDEWQVLHQSAQTFRLMRERAGKRLKYGQLVSLCPHDGERFLLAKITWLRQQRNGSLAVEVGLLPGIPQAIAARPLAQQPENTELFSQAFLLPPVRAVGAEPALVLPRGWYKPGRIVEIDSGNEGGEIWLAKMVNIVDDGVDFERVGFSLAN